MTRDVSVTTVSYEKENTFCGQDNHKHSDRQRHRRERHDRSHSRKDPGRPEAGGSVLSPDGQAFGGTVSIHPAMTPEDLEKAMHAMG